MHVEIDDGGALGAVLALRVTRRDRGIVEQAEAHRPRGLGVVAGRAGGDKGIGRLAGHHLVHRQHGAAGGAQCGLVAARRHRGVGVEMQNAFGGRGVADRLDIVHRMDAGDCFERRQRRLHARQHLELLVLQRLLDGAQTVRPFGMSGGREMVEAGGVGDEQSGHCCVVTRARSARANLSAVGLLIRSSPQSLSPRRRGAGTHTPQPIDGVPEYGARASLANARSFGTTETTFLPPNSRPSAAAWSWARRNPPEEAGSDRHDSGRNHWRLRRRGTCRRSGSSR